VAALPQGWKSGFIRFSEWFSRLAYINLLWLGFTFIGLIFFGLIPATVAMFAVLRKWMKEDLDSSIFKTFWDFYRKEFKKSNIAGITMLIIGYILFMDIFVFELESMPIIQFLLYILAFFYLLVMVFFFPVYVQFELKWFQYVKMSVLMVFAAPFRAILMLIIGYGVFFLMAKIPVVMFFFLGSAISYLWLMISLPTFYKLETR
jgi:uncharacterized membrane protein YesL